MVTMTQTTSTTSVTLLVQLNIEYCDSNSSDFVAIIVAQSVIQDLGVLTRLASDLNVASVLLR